MKRHGDRCCNPYNDAGHKGKDLRLISKNLIQHFPSVPPNAKICWDCRHRNNESSDGMETESFKNLSDESQSVINMEHDIASLHSAGSVMVRSSREIELEEMLNGLKEHFASLSLKDPQKLNILTIAPETWSVDKIASEFGCSWQLAKRSKELRASKGILGHTTVESARKLPEDTIKKVLDFYVNDSNSRIMPGKKDVVSVKGDEGRCLIQKRLLLMDLRGLYLTYKESHSDFPLSFSKFAQLRPKYCVLAGSSGTHSMCVCTIHQNCKLLLDAVHIEKLTQDSQNPIKGYKDCLKEITCVNPNEQCNLGECNRCPDIETFLQFLQELMEKQDIFQVKFSTWTGTDRSTLLTQILPTSDYIAELGDKLLLLKPHSFIAKAQSQFFEDKKNNLDEGEVLVVLDFSENYKYFVQDASQAFHFNNTQCTVFPVVYYYKDNSVLQHKSLVFLSDSTRHDTAAVYTVQKMLIPHIKKNLGVKRIVYFSDGAKQHFKNKFQMINLVNHETDFGVQAEWHCHATAHGKGASDGVGAVFKREAARSSLLCKPSDAILSPEKLLNWAQKHFKTITTSFYSRVEHEKVTRSLRRRFDQAPAVPEIQKSHSFTVLKTKELFIKRFSSANTGKKVVYRK